MLRPHLQTMLWKAADKESGLQFNITEFGWEVLNIVPSPVIASGPPAPPDLLKVIGCQCRAAENACAQANCSCFVSGLSCTLYCHCEGSTEEYHNPMMRKDEDVAAEAHVDGTSDETGVVDLGPDTFLDPLEY